MSLCQNTARRHALSFQPALSRARLRRFKLGAALIAVAAMSAPVVQAHSQHAHVHGQVELGVAIEGPTIVIEMRTPLADLIGFERAPRNDVEKNTVDQTLARLRAADHLFMIDPAGNCKLGPVTLDAPVLGLVPPPAPATPKDTAATPAAPAAPKNAKDEHAELLASFAFNCSSAEQAKFIDLDLFKAFTAMRQIDAEIATADGQYKRTLRRPASRLSWSQ